MGESFYFFGFLNNGDLYRSLEEGVRNKKFQIWFLPNKGDLITIPACMYILDPSTERTKNL